jgi:hypothetical protein
MVTIAAQVAIIGSRAARKLQGNLRNAAQEPPKKTSCRHMHAWCAGGSRVVDDGGLIAQKQE